MLARLCFVLVFSLLGAACAVNPLTPTPMASATPPPVVVVALAAAGTSVPPLTPGVELAAATAAGGAALTAPTDSPPTIGVVVIGITESVSEVVVPTEAPVVVAQAQVAETLPPAPPPTEAPPAPTAVPPVLVAPPPAGDVAAAEQYCIDLINAQRANAGLPPYARDETVMGIARARVADMVARGYRGHNDPVTGESLGPSMLRAAGFRLAGENWFGHRSGPVEIVDAAMGWFMTDPPHAQGILSSGFSLVGVGIAFNGSQWLLIQNFAGS